MLVHSGTADGGHYYSFIKERNGTAGRWLQFDDSHVREFDKALLGQECFGGNQDANGNKGSGNRGFLDDFAIGGNSFERCRNAYLLFYERV